MTGATRSDRSAHWSRYWAKGALTSLPQDFSGNYDGEIAAFWHEQFDRVPDGGHLVDICTGNGAIALLAADRARQLGREWHIIGLDAARLDPSQMAAQHRGHGYLLEHIELLDEQPFEVVSLKAGSVDLLTSQYGIEYCDWPRAANQAVRLLKTGGHLAMVSHAVDSDLLATMRNEAREYERIARLKFVPALTAWIDERIDARRFHQVVRDVRRAVGREYRHRPTPLYRYVLQVVETLWRAGQEQYPRYRQSLVAVRDELVSGHGRLADMLRVNEAMAEDPGWTRLFVDAGLIEIDGGELLYQQRHRVGRFNVFRKP